MEVIEEIRTIQYLQTLFTVEPWRITEKEKIKGHFFLEKNIKLGNQESNNGSVYLRMAWCGYHGGGVEVGKGDEGAQNLSHNVNWSWT